ncbi:hypothetical protein J2M53_14470 [Arthrobacter sp. zg-ZUI100]|nr:hypothetical protein [Arthrobacter jiangjiafuii]MBP3037451.1 hypothetical protein [Arthrobacter jiangjiafuii]
MLAQAVSRSSECAELFNRLLDRTDLQALESSSFEFAAQGTPYSLGDKTLLDMLLRFRTRSGALQVVAVETKLADRFSTRRTAAAGQAKYVEIARLSALWHDMAAAVNDNRTRQLTRCHALAQSVQHHDGGLADQQAVLVVLTHPEDSSGAECVARYSKRVSADRAIVHCSWAEYLKTARSVGAIETSAINELSSRYVDLALSDEAWVGFNERSKKRSA